MRLQTPALLSLLVSLAACSSDIDDQTTPVTASESAWWDGKADGTAKAPLYVSASSVEQLDGDLSSMSPPVARAFWGDLVGPSTYLVPMSCLGYYGPIGPWGPLGVKGPLGDNAWSADLYVSGEGALPWYDYAQSLSASNGPLSGEGPLGPNGPLGDAYLDDSLIGGDFDVHLRGGGVWTVLGPLGPLGPLGALGPLGPVGAHGYTRDADGQYRKGTKVVRTLDVPWDGGKRRYELFEEYTEELAKRTKSNDTSFMVLGHVSPSSEVDTYRFKSASDQLVTILVVPESASMFTPQAMGVLYAAALIGFATPPIAPLWPATTDDFDLRLEDGKGRLVATSSSRRFADWIQLRVPKGVTLKASVSMRSTWDFWSASPTSSHYRLYVVGATANIPSAGISGDHQVPAGK